MITFNASSVSPYYAVYDEVKLYYIEDAILEKELIVEKENIKKVVRSEFGEIQYRFHEPFVNTFPVNKYKIIAIASDGILSWSFIFNVFETFKECVTYKNTNGAFLQRRMIRFISNLESLGYNHHDDISIGAFCRED